MKGTSLDELHKKWLEERPGYKKAYDALEEEFDLAAAMIEARLKEAERLHKEATNGM